MRYVIKKIGLSLGIHRYRALSKLCWELEPSKTRYVIMTEAEYQRYAAEYDARYHKINQLEIDAWHRAEKHREELQRQRYELVKEREKAVSAEFDKFWQMSREKQAVIEQKETEISGLNKIIEELSEWQRVQMESLRSASMADKINESGYTVIGTMQVLETIAEAERKIAWKTTLSTPYEVTQPIKIIEDVIYTDLNGVLGEMGVDEMQFLDPGEYPETDGRDNIAYRYMFRGNTRAGSWEVEVWTTSDVSIPPYMLPNKKKNRQKEGSKGSE